MTTYSSRPSSLKNSIQDTVRDIKVTLSSDEYDYQNIALQCWQDGNENLSERMKALGDYMIFEDVYLKQPYYRYFTINVDNESDEYVISLELDYKYFTKNFELKQWIYSTNLCNYSTF